MDRPTLKKRNITLHIELELKSAIKVSFKISNFLFDLNIHINTFNQI